MKHHDDETTNEPKASTEPQEAAPVYLDETLADAPNPHMLTAEQMVEPVIESGAAEAEPAAEAGESDEEAVATPRIPDSLVVKQQYETFSAIPLNYKFRMEPLSMPGSTFDHLREAINSAPNVRLDDTAQGSEWATIMNEGQDYGMAHAAFEAAVKREGSNWVQSMLSEKGALMGSAPIFKDAPGQLLTGERAVLRLRHVTGQGSVYQVPLWHSGFWVTLKAPSDGAQLELQRRIMQEKIDLGRDIRNLAFSNHSSYMSGWLLDFALTHVYDSTLKTSEGVTVNNLRDHIVAMDIPALLWGLVCVMYPKGFPYAQACVQDVSKCNYVIKELLDPTKLQWTDFSAFTPWQLAHMSNRNKPVTLENIKRFRDEFTRGRPRKVQLSEEVSAVLKVPTAQEYLSSGNLWVSNIVSMVDQAFNLEPEDGQRNAFIKEQGQATTMRQYGHWVETIELIGDQTINDSETVDLSLNTLSGLDDLADNYFDEIGKFMDDSTISVIAIPTHQCPKCQTPRDSTLPRFPHLLPLDVMSTFFTLLAQKCLQIRSR